MFLGKIRNRLATWRLSLAAKLTLSLSAIAVILVVSSIISLMEYRRMSSYVSGLIADNINSINVAQKLSEVTDKYNLDILSVIGDEQALLPTFNQEEFVSRCDSLKKNLTSVSLLPLADSVMYSYAAYMLTTLEFEDVLLSDFIDSRTWYFDRLQPKFNRLRGDIDALSAGMYNDLKKNSETFERGFYRSIIPGLVAVLAGGEDHKALPGGKAPLREGPAVAPLPVGNAAARELQRLIGDVCKLDPVGKIPVLIRQGSPVFDHQLRNADLSRVLVVGHRRGTWRLILIPLRLRPDGRCALRRRFLSAGGRGLRRLPGGERRHQHQHRRHRQQQGGQHMALLRSAIVFLSSGHCVSSNPTKLQNIIAQKMP